MEDWLTVSERQKIEAYEALADHPLFKGCYNDFSGSLLDKMLDLLDNIYYTAVEL